MSGKLEKKYYLSKKMIIFLFVYFGMILFFGVLISVCLAININVHAKDEADKDKILLYTFLIPALMSAAFCSIRYTQYLYKACINLLVVLDDNTIINRIGNFAYFILRPFFATAFSVAMVFSVLSGMCIVSGSLDVILNEKLVYLCASLSTILGYSIGKLIDKFKEFSSEKIENLKIGA